MFLSASFACPDVLVSDPVPYTETGMRGVPKPFLFLLAGDVSAPIRRLLGDYDACFRAMLELDQDQTAVVRAHCGEPLPDHAAARAIVVSGSPAMISDHHPWAEEAAGWLRVAVERGVPVLGICFGHQLLAHACGGQVARMTSGPEYGTVEVACTAEASSDPLFAHLTSGFCAQESHCEAVSVLPPGAVRLARSPADTNHAFRIGACAWGVQFHPERTAEAMRLSLRSNAEALGAAGRDVERLIVTARESPEAATVLRAFRRVVDGA